MPEVRSRLRFVLAVGLLMGAPLIGIRPLSGGVELHAQELRGQVVDRESSLPVAGAMLVALDSGGEAGARTLTDDQGGFVMQLPPAFRPEGIQVLRIGYASRTYPLPAEAGSAPILLEIASAPIELEGIGVVADNLCGEAFEGSGRTYDIWSEAQKALAMTWFSQTERVLNFETELTVRRLDPESLRELDREVTPRQLRGRTPYYSLTGSQMTETGWVQRDEDGSLRYWAPDARALLSREFIDQHCFGSEITDEEILLRFEPNRARRGTPDIRGEMALDRDTHRLTRLSFEYTSLPLPREASGYATGEVRFMAAPSGVWAVAEWWIRMPIVTRTETTLGSIGARTIRTEVRELREESGRVLRFETEAEVIDVEGGIRA